MKIAVITDSTMKEELLVHVQNSPVQLQWLEEPAGLPGTDAYVDLLFEPSAERMEKLKQLSPATIIINAVSFTLKGVPGNFVRINGWPGFLKRAIMEASCQDNNTRNRAENIFSSFGKKTEWVPDIPGFISARVISMIINEAYFTLQEKVSSKQEIDIAMKLGTNYPYGPFKWAEKIGLKKIYTLLSMLAKDNSRYKPCPLLEKEINA